MFGVWFEGSFVQESKKDTHTLLLSLSSVWWKRHYQQRRRFGLFTAHSENKILTRFSTDWRRYSARTWLTWETLMRNINWPRANLLKVFSPKCIHTTPCHPYSRLCHWSTSCGQRHQCRRQIRPPAAGIKVKIKITKTSFLRSLLTVPQSSDPPRLTRPARTPSSTVRAPPLSPLGVFVNHWYLFKKFLT